MLCLEPRHDSVLYRSALQSTVGLDKNLVQVDAFQTNYRYFRGRNISPKYIGVPDLPFVFNFDKYIQDTIVLQGSSQDEIDESALADVLNAYIRRATELSEEGQSNLTYLRLFAYDYKCLDDLLLDNVYFESHINDNIDTLFKKAMEDTKDREALTDIENIGVRIYHDNTHNFLIEVVNVDDRWQASDYFLTLGIMPLLFEEVRDKFNEEELDYCKTLVRRSQIKRIRNVDAENYYMQMSRSRKYQDAMQDFRLKTQLEGILRQRRRIFETRLNDAISRKDALLQQYQDVLRIMETATAQLGKLEDDKSFTEEIEMVAKMECMREFDLRGSAIVMSIVTPLEYYDPELLELNLERNPERYNSILTNRFFKDVFIDEKYSYYVGNQFLFRLDEERVQLPGNLNYNINTTEQHCLYNPHIQYYRCYGSNEVQIIQAHAEKDLIGYVNALISSLKNINFADSAVFGRWYTSLSAMLMGGLNDGNDERRFITDKFLLDKETNEFISLEDYANRIREEMNANAPEIEVEEL